MSQLKEKNETTQKELNEMEASIRPDTEFKTLVFRILRELSENFNK